MSELRIEINANGVAEPSPLTAGQRVVLITPPIGEDYWLLRVPVSETQAVVAFPKFTTMGIGFQREEDWNTNLPWREDARSIFAHIAHNKGDATIPDERCITAIELLQQTLREMKASSPQAFV